MAGAPSSSAVADGAQPATNGTTNGVSSAGKDPHNLKELRKKQPAEVRKLLKLLKRKKSRQQKHQKDFQALAAEEREQLRKCVSRKKRSNPFVMVRQPMGGQRQPKQDSGDAIAEEDEATESEEEDDESKGKKESREGGGSSTAAGDSSDDDHEEEADEDGNLEIRYVVADETAGPDAELAKQFNEVFEKFRPLEEEEDGDEEDDEEEDEDESERKRKTGQDLTLEDDDYDDDGEEEGGEKGGTKNKKGEKGGKKLTKKQKKLMSRPSLAELKQKTNRPDMVEIWDTCSADPEFLVYLKGLRNIVPVPPHWAHKRRYLQWKRGFEKPPFKLPPHIEATKISEVRSALVEAESQKTLRQRMREKVRPKQNKLAIDYQVLHDCFFKYAVKPSLTGFGDLYYEGKEFEKKNKNFTCGQLSDRLKQALGMGPLAPPPWLINMQRYGPPPAYPRLKIPGLNAPIPPGCSYGYHAGGWGKPPVNEFGQPLYEADGTGAEEEEDPEADMGIAMLWGELPDGVEEEEEEDEGGEGKEGAAPGTPAGAETPFLEGGIASIGGATSITSGLDSPASFDIRKRPGGTSSLASSAAKPYTILTPQEVPAGQQQGQLFGVKHTYKIPGGGAAGVATPGGQMTPGGHSTPRISSGIVTPFGGIAGTSSSGVRTPMLAGGSGMHTPFGGNRTPFGTGGRATPVAGSQVGGFASVPGTPFAGAAGTVSGVQTPARPGFATPAGITVSLNPNEMEQEGVFTADVIRQQLRHHEEAAARAKQAAGQVDPAESRKRKGDEIRGTQTVTKTKKKKQFKF